MPATQGGGVLSVREMIQEQPPMPHFLWSVEGKWGDNKVSAHLLKGDCPFAFQKPHLLLAKPSKVGENQKMWSKFLELKCQSSNPLVEEKSFQCVCHPGYEVNLSGLEQGLSNVRD